MLVNHDPEYVFKAPYFGINADKHNLFLNQIPKHIVRNDIYQLVSKLNGFVGICLSEPIKSQNNIRYCWVSFDSEDSLNAAQEKIQNASIARNGYEYKLNPIKSRSLGAKKITVTPPLFAERIQQDLFTSKELIELLDKKREIEVSCILTMYVNYILDKPNP
jgi:hypothetical protein